MFKVYTNRYTLHEGVERSLNTHTLLGYALSLGILVFGSIFVYSAILPSIKNDESVVTAQTLAKPKVITADNSAIAKSGNPRATDISAIATTVVQSALPQDSGSTWSVAVYDLKNNRWIVQINAQQQMESASLYKLYMVYALAQKLPFASWGQVTVDDHTVLDCVDLMLRISDNDCGDAIGKYVGWGTADRLIHSAGYNDTTLNLATGPVTTAGDTSSLLRDLYEGKLLSPDATNFVLGSLLAQKYRSGIPSGCSGCTVYNKTGSSSDVTHDSAIVKTSSGDYVVTIMSKGGSYQQIANIESSLESVISQYSSTSGGQP